MCVFCIEDMGLEEVGQGIANQRIKKALELAYQYGQIDGGHHRLWVIDQMVRALLDEEDYSVFVKAYQEPLEDDGEMSYEWETGIAP